MTVYIETVILDNFFMTLLSALLSYRAVNARFSALRIFCACALGTALAVIFPVIALPWYGSVLYKIATAVLLSSVLFFKKTSYLKGTAAFLTSTFLFGGALFALGLAQYGDIYYALSKPVDIPLWLILAPSVLFFIIFNAVFLHVKKLKKLKTFLREFEVDIFDKTHRFVGLIDTGNRLSDGGGGVVVLSSAASFKILGENKLQLLLGENPDGHYVEYTTVGQTKSKKILTLKPNAIRLYSEKGEHILKSTSIGLSLTALKPNSSYDAILPHYAAEF